MNDQQRTSPGFLAWVLGIIPLFLGTIVIFGWFSGNQNLIQIRPTYAPMQFNTALGFLLCGAGLVAFHARQRKLGYILGATVSVLGFLSLLQYILNTDFGIDNLIVDPYITTKTSHPGRMAPNTAICFGFSGLFLVLFGASWEKKACRLLGATFSTIVGSLAFISLFGYWTNQESAYGWGNLTRMAVHTSVGFVFVAIGFFEMAVRRDWRSKNTLPDWIALPPSFAVLTAGFCLWQALVVHEGEQQSNKLATGVLMAANIDNRIEDHSEALQRMARRQEFKQSFPDQELESDVYQYLEHISSLDGIFLLDQEFQVHWSSSKDGTQPKALSGRTDFKAFAEFIDSEEVDQRPVFLPGPETIGSPSREILILIGIQSPGGVGYLCATLDLGVVAQETRVKSIQDYSYQIQYQGASYWSNAVAGHTPPSELLTGWKSLPMGDEWTIYSWPSEYESTNESSAVPLITLAISSLIGLFTFSVLKLAIAVHDKSVALQRTISQLKTETQERKQAEETLTARNHDLETIMYTLSHDLKEPLRSMESFTKRVIDRHSENLGEKGSDYLNRVWKNTQRLDGLLEDILHLSRALRMEEPKSDIPLKSIVDDVIERLADRIEETGATVQVQEPLPALPVNPIWAGEAIFNLLSNALKFHIKGHSPDVEIAGYPSSSDSMYGIRVADRGPGVDEEFAADIFGLFKRAVGRDVEGRGAGLAIVREVAEKHGGQTWVQSREGGGSEFIITFERVGSE